MQAPWLFSNVETGEGPGSPKTRPPTTPTLAPHASPAQSIPLRRPCESMSKKLKKKQKTKCFSKCAYMYIHTYTNILQILHIIHVLHILKIFENSGADFGPLIPLMQTQARVVQSVRLRALRKEHHRRTWTLGGAWDHSFWESISKGVNNCSYHPEVCFRYMILKLLGIWDHPYSTICKVQLHSAAPLAVALVLPSLLRLTSSSQADTYLPGHEQTHGTPDQAYRTQLKRNPTLSCIGLTNIRLRCI